jgi:hypothetical protein
MLTALILAATALAARTPTPPEHVTPPAVAPPETRDCEADYPADQYNDRLDCRSENVNAAAFAYVDSALEHDRIRRALGGSPIFTDAQTEQLLTSRDRAQSAKDRTHQAQMFRASVRKQKAEDEDCYVKEIIGDSGPHAGDDLQPCTKNEDCEEVLDDGIGDDDGICNLRGNNREVCVQVCQQPLPSDDENYDGNVAAESEQGLIELEGALRDATEEIKKSTRRMLATFAARPLDRIGTACDQYQFDQFPGLFALQTAQVAKNITGAAFNACSVLCHQDAFGWNCQAACLGFSIVDGIANIVFDAFDLVDGDNGGEQLDRMARCTTELSQDVASISGAVGGTQESLDEVNARLDAIEASLAALSESMHQRFDSVDTLLCTPQGQRACFPAPEEAAARSVGRGAG